MEWRRYLAELIATFALVFIGAGAVLTNTFSKGAVGLTGIALAHGLVLMAMVYATAHISGGHVNPAVTIAMLFARKINLRRAVGYIIAQLVGAALAGSLLWLIFPNMITTVHLGAPDLGAGVPVLTGIIIEAVLTFFLVFTIFGVAVDKRAPAGMYGIAIGLVLTFDILMGGPLTGAAMNPARAFGPAFAANFWQNQLVYWIGPIIGAVVAGLLYEYLLIERRGKKAASE